MRYPCNHVCFPCRKSARVGYIARVFGSAPEPGVPHCPGCGNKMLRWASKVPKREKDWVAIERNLADNYLWMEARRNPSHPQYWMREFGGDNAGLFRNPCAPPFFR